MSANIKFSIASKRFGGCNSVTLPSQVAIPPVTLSGNTHCCCSPVAANDCIGCSTGYIPQRWDIELPAALSYGALPLTDSYFYTTNSGTCGVSAYDETTYSLSRAYYDIESLGDTLPCFKLDGTCVWSNSAYTWTGWRLLDANSSGACGCSPSSATSYGTASRLGLSYAKAATGTQRGVLVGDEIGSPIDDGDLIPCDSDPFDIPHQVVYHQYLRHGMSWRLTPTATSITVDILWIDGGRNTRRIYDSTIPYTSDLSVAATVRWEAWFDDTEFQAHGAQMFPEAATLNDIKGGLGTVSYTASTSCSQINGTPIELTITDSSKITKAAKFGITNLPSTINVRPFN